MPNQFARDAKSKPKIRWRKSDIDLLKREVKNFNTRLRTAYRKWGEGAVFLPSKETTKGYRNRFRTRQEFNDYINQLKFGKAETFQPIEQSLGHGAQREVIITSKYQQRAGEVSEVKAAGRYRSLEMILQELDTSPSPGAFPSESEILKRRINRARGNTLEDRVRNVLSDIVNDNRLEAWRQSYIQRVYNTVSDYVNIRSVDEATLDEIMGIVNDIIRIVSSISGEAFYIAMGLDPLTGFTFAYQIEAFIDNLQRVYNEWSKYDGL